VSLTLALENKMKKINNLVMSVLLIGVILILGLSLVSAGNLFGRNSNDHGGDRGLLGNLFEGNNNDDNTDVENTAGTSVPAFQEYDFEGYGVELGSLEWDADPPVWHSADEIKIRADDGNYYSLQEALDHGLIRLPIGKIPNGVLLEFTLPQGSPEWYDRVCPSSYGKNKQDQYAEYAGEFTITNPLIYDGGVYDFSCSVGDKPGTVVTKVLLNESYNVIVSVKEPRIERIANVLGEKEIENGEDMYSYLVSLENNKLKFRITRPSSCRNNRITNLQIPLCIPSGGTIAGLFSSTNINNDEIIFEPLATSGTGYCSSGGSCNSLPTSEVGGCTGSVCSCRVGRSGCYSSRDQIPGLQPQNQASGGSGLNCNILPPIEISLPEKSCRNDQCPIYTVRSGILGGFEEKEIYKWQELKCSVKAVY